MRHPRHSQCRNAAIRKSYIKIHHLINIANGKHALSMQCIKFQDQSMGYLVHSTVKELLEDMIKAAKVSRPDLLIKKRRHKRILV